MLASDRVFPVDPQAHGIAHGLYQTVADKPITSPRSHADPARFAENLPFADATQLLSTLDDVKHGRGLAVLDGAYPVLNSGPVRWFHDAAACVAVCAVQMRCP